MNGAGRYSDLQKAIREALAAQLRVPVEQVSKLDIQQSKKVCHDLNSHNSSSASSGGAARSHGGVSHSMSLAVTKQFAEHLCDKAAIADFQKALREQLAKELHVPVGPASRHWPCALGSAKLASQLWAGPCLFPRFGARGSQAESIEMSVNSNKTCDEATGPSGPPKTKIASRPCASFHS